MFENNFLNFLNNTLSKTYEDFSETTVERTKWIILDCMAACYDGMQSEELKQLAAQFGCAAPTKEQHIPVIGQLFYTNPSASLLLHGAALVSNELDEGNQFAKGHPAAHIFAPAYTAAIEQKATGKEFIRAFVLAYEISARFAYAANMKDEFHPHGTWGVIGGAAAVGILKKKSVEELISMIVLAASLPLATSWEAAVQGQTVRNLYTGIAAQIAYQTADFQQSGFQSSMAVVEHIWGSLLSNRLDSTVFAQDFWEPPLLEKNFMKYYPSCRFSHSSIDALLKITDQRTIDCDEIQTVKVETYGLAARLSETKPANKLSAKFSIPFLLSALLHKQNLYESFEANTLTSSSIQGLASKIKVEENKQMTEALPGERAAKVTVTLLTGEQLTGQVTDASGSFKEGLSTETLLNKYKQMLKQEKLAMQLTNFVMELEEAGQFDKWVAEMPRETGVMA